MANIQDLTKKEIPNWCPGCGNFAILMAIKKAISELSLNTKDVVIVSGIGCSSKISHYIGTYAYESLHGRAIPVALGIKLANNDLKVIVMGGDGDGYGIGLNHMIHGARRNIDITYIVHNNELYALTTGQSSPTTEEKIKTSSTPFGNLEYPLNPLALSLSAGATFIARSISFDVAHMTEVFKKAILHNGFSIVDVLQMCISYPNEINPSNFKDKVSKEETIYTNRSDAFKYVSDHNNFWKLGVFFEEYKTTLDEKIFTQIS